MSEPHTLEAGASDPVTWHPSFRCPECRCREFARVAEKKPDGSFGSGPMVRCVECKRTYRSPDPFAATASSAGPVPDEMRRNVESLVKTIKDTIEVWDKYPGTADDGAEALWQILPHVERLLATPSGRPDTPPAGGGAVMGAVLNMPNPTPEELASPQFEAIWQAIKSWDVNVPEAYGGYCGANGSHVAMILRALTAAPEPAAGGLLAGDWKLSEETQAYLRDIDLATVKLGDPRLNMMVGPCGPAAGLDGYGSQARPVTAAPEPAAGGGREIVGLLKRMRAASGSEGEGGDCSCHVAGGSDAWQLHDPFCAYRLLCEAADLIEADPAITAPAHGSAGGEGLAEIIATKHTELAPIFLDMGKRSAGPRIYMASKTAHAPRWRQLRAEGVPIISTWIDEAGKGETADFTDLWERCVDEAATATAVIVYREPGEVLKGAFVEVGAALSMGVSVYAVGCDEFSFVHHAGVTRFDSLAAALEAAKPTPATSSTPAEEK